MNLDVYKQEYRKIVLSESKREMKFHVLFFIFMILFLSILNYIKTPNYFWIGWIFSGWGVGLLIHYFFGYKNMDNELSKFEALAEMNAKNIS